MIPSSSSSASSKQLILSDESRRKEAIDSHINDLITDKDTQESPESSNSLTKAGLVDEHGEREDAAYVYIRSALERGWTLSFVESLQECKKKKEYEIDKICRQHYESFLDSMNEVLGIRSSIIELSRNVSSINNEFTSAGIEVAFPLPTPSLALARIHTYINIRTYIYMYIHTYVDLQTCCIYISNCTFCLLYYHNILCSSVHLMSLTRSLILFLLFRFSGG